MCFAVLSARAITSRIHAALRHEAVITIIAHEASFDPWSRFTLTAQVLNDARFLFHRRNFRLKKKKKRLIAAAVVKRSIQRCCQRKSLAFPAAAAVSRSPTARATAAIPPDRCETRRCLLLSAHCLQVCTHTPSSVSEGLCQPLLVLYDYITTTV